MAEAKKLREIARFKTNNPEWLGIVNGKLEDLPHLNTFQQLDPLYNELLVLKRAISLSFFASAIYIIILYFFKYYIFFK